MTDAIISTDRLVELRNSLKLKYEGSDKYGSALNEILSLLDENIKDRSQTTCGNFKTEKDAEEAFDGYVNRDFFIVEKEVKGRRLYDDRPVVEGGQSVRIDRILHPTLMAIGAGWKMGPICVEIKKSNMAMGPIIAQFLEYRQSLFLSKYLNNTRIMPIVGAIFPSDNIYHDLHSIQHSQIILSCNIRKDYTTKESYLRLGTSSGAAVSIYRNRIDVGSFVFSTRKGHRGREK